MVDDAKSRAGAWRVGLGASTHAHVLDPCKQTMPWSWVVVEQNTQSFSANGNSSEQTPFRINDITATQCKL